MSRIGLLLGIAVRSRLRGFTSAGASSILAVLGGLFHLGLTCAMGAGAFLFLAQSRGARLDRVADATALVVTMFGVFFLVRPLIATTMAGASLQNLLHLPVKRGELLIYSLVTGVATPLLLESPVLIGAGLGAASQPTAIVVTLPLALLAHVTLLTGAHAMSLFSVLIARRAWVSDAARVIAFSILFLPSLLTMRGPRNFLRPFLEVVALLSPLGWAARAAVYGGAGDLGRAFWFAIPALAFLLGIALVSVTLLNRILAGQGEDREKVRRATPHRTRVLLPGALGALIETQLRAQLRTPAARMALLMPTLMMGLFTLALSRPNQPPGGTFAMVVFLSLIGGNPFAVVGRGIALVLGTPVSRASILIANDASGALFRLPPILAIILVTGLRVDLTAALQMTALAITLVPISMGVQHFAAILRPSPLPRDRFNPYARRADMRQSGQGFLSLLATVLTFVIASPLLLLWWLSSRLPTYGPWLLALSTLGALATYAVLIALAERMLLRRELKVIEILLDDSPA